MEEKPESVLPLMLDAFWQATGSTLRDPIHAEAHRWHYALPTEPLAERCLYDSTSKIGACGDWCGGPRVEGAYLSGKAIAAKVAHSLISPHA